MQRDQIELRHEGIIVVARGFECARSGGEVGAERVARNISIATAVQRDPLTVVIAAATEVGTVEERCAHRVELRHECITKGVRAAASDLECAGGGGKVGAVRYA